MKDKRKLMQKIRQSEAELVYADPARVAKLTGKIVKWKARVFD